MRGPGIWAGALLLGRASEEEGTDVQASLGFQVCTTTVRWPEPSRPTVWQTLVGTMVRTGQRTRAKGKEKRQQPGRLKA